MFGTLGSFKSSLWYSHPPCAFVRVNATRKPANNAIPFPNPSFLNDSGILDSPNMTKIAPAAKAIDIEIIGGEVLDSTV